jgi:hypothetical protein
MISRETKKVYYETEVIKQVTCDICDKDITEEEFFKLELAYSYVADEGKHISKVMYDENSCWNHICKECAVKFLKSINKNIKEYVEYSLL